MEACLLAASLSAAALLSLVLFGWEETAPERVADDIGSDGGAAEPLLSTAADDNNGTRAEGGAQARGGKRRGGGQRRRPALLNPFSIVTVFFGNRCVVLVVSFGSCLPCAATL